MKIKPSFSKRSQNSFLIGILFLFFIQNISTLISSIYIMDLLFTSLDEKIIGLVFILSPILLLLIKDKSKNISLLIAGLLTVICRVILPLTSTVPDIIIAGIGTASFLVFLPTLLSTKTEKLDVNFGFGFTLSVLASVTLRTIGSTMDVSMTGTTQIIGLILAVIAVALLIKNYVYIKEDNSTQLTTTHKSRSGSALAIMSSITLIYFVFSSPGVISRWTGADYNSTIIVYALILTVTAIFFSMNNSIFQRIKTGLLTVWNAVFFVSLILTILFNTIPFPQTHESMAVTVYTAPWYQHIPMYIMLILSPVLFINISFFSRHTSAEKASMKKLAVSYTLAGLFTIVMVLMLIFTNVWGYVEPVSLFFRNKFYLPFLLIGIAIIIPCLMQFRKKAAPEQNEDDDNSKTKLNSFNTIAAGVLTVVCIFSLIVTSPNPNETSTDNDELTLMAYNCQQGVDIYGNINADDQVKLLKSIDADIIALQESDTARISIGNFDVVKYFADNLGYYSYYGPKTVTGTYGTAILSKYPLENTRSIFTYSNQDEVGTTFAEVTFNGQLIGIVCVHPCGNDNSDQAFTDALLDTVLEYDYVVSMGDYNMRETEACYSQIAEVLNDSWKELWSNPGEANAPEIAHRIDYIFLSDNFEVIQSEYIPSPQSETDHPAHWCKVKLK